LIIKINPLCVPLGERVWQGGGCDTPRLLLRRLLALMMVLRLLVLRS